MYKLPDEVAKNINKELEELFERWFTHMDFWILSRKWKIVFIRNRVSIIQQIIEMEVERALIHYDPNYKSKFRE